MKFRTIFLAVGSVLIFALFVASSWEAWQQAKEKTATAQNEKNISTEQSSTPPCSPAPLWAERCFIINGHALFIAVGDIVDTDAKRAQGLSGRESMAENQGMLFVFNSPAQYSFWMKDMKFALDFLWIRDDKIVEITQNVPPPAPGEQPQTITPKMPVDAVLEVNAGWAQTNGAQEGAQISGLPT